MIEPIEIQSCKETFKNPFFYITAIAITAFLYTIFGATSAYFSAAVFSIALLVLTFIDFKHMILPDIITIPFIGLGIIAAPYNGMTYLEATIGATLGFLLFFLIYWGYMKIRGFEGMGLGDVKLLAMLGAWCGAMQIPLILLIASFIGLAAFGVRAMLSGIKGDIPMPFGPFLTLGAGLSFLYAESLWMYIFQTREFLSQQIIGLFI